MDLAERKRRAATAELRRLVRSSRVEERGLDVEGAVVDHSSRLRSVFQIVRTPDWASRESLLREARRQPPASISWDGPGAGARDVAIWLTAIAACQEKGEETYFVSADNAAFGRELKPELAADLDARLAGRASAFHYCNGVDALLGELATRHQQVPGRDRIADSEPVRTAVEAILEDPMLIFELAAGAALPDAALVTADPDGLKLTSKTGREVAYQIGDTIWACARPTWQASMMFETVSRAYRGDSLEIGNPVGVTYKVTTTLVMQIDVDGTISAAEVIGRSQAFGIEQRAIG